MIGGGLAGQSRTRHLLIFCWVSLNWGSKFSLGVLCSRWGGGLVRRCWRRGITGKDSFWLGGCWKMGLYGGDGLGNKTGREILSAISRLWFCFCNQRRTTRVIKTQNPGLLRCCKVVNRPWESILSCLDLLPHKQ